MGKKLCIVFLAIAAAVPVCSASFFSFSRPAVWLGAPKWPVYGDRPSREAYKPYPAPRGGVPVSQYAIERKRHLAAIGASFQLADEEYKEALQAADEAASDFDALTMGGF